MGYESTRLRREFHIDELITIHYFEYPLNFVFRGEAHDFREFLCVDRGSIRVTAGREERTLTAGQAIFHEPLEFHAFRSIGKRPPNLAVVSFVSKSPFFDFFSRGVFYLSKEERRLISNILANAVECFSTPLNVPSVEKMELREDAPPGRTHMILLYLELFLLTVYRNRTQAPESLRALRPLDGEAQGRETENLVGEVVSYLE